MNKKVNIFIGEATDFLTSVSQIAINYKFKKVNLKTALEYIPKTVFLDMYKECIHTKFITYEINCSKILKIELEE